MEKLLAIRNLPTSWVPPYRSEYNIARFQGYTSVIPQTEESLLFVPYATWSWIWAGGSDSNQGALKSGWKNEISMICYYDASKSTWSERYGVCDDKAYLNGNRVFLTQDIYRNINNGGMSEFNSLCTDGVFYTKIAGLLVNKNGLNAEKNDTELIKIDALKKQLGTAAGVKTL